MIWTEFGTDLVSLLVYFASGAIAIWLYTFIDTVVTPHKEFALIKAQNQAAVVAFAGSLLGFVVAITLVEF